MDKIILASQSPRRKQLLEWADIDFDVIVSDTDEAFDPSSSFEDAAMHIAENKAFAVQAKGHYGRTIVAADTIVVCGGKIIGKPASRDEAVEFLKLLSGNEHKVITGVCILRGQIKVLFQDTTIVEFHPLENFQIDYYVDKYKPYDKAGAYAIQEWIGVTGIKKINGDFYNVMGLPVSRVLQELNKF